MSDPEVGVREAAAAVSTAEDHLDQLKAQRNQAMADARAAGLTWRAIAAAAGMTEHGVRKALAHSRSEQQTS